MIEVRLTIAFQGWLKDLKDRQAKDRIIARLRRFEVGNLEHRAEKWTRFSGEHDAKTNR